jgi:hypothetical protein
MLFISKSMRLEVFGFILALAFVSCQSGNGTSVTPSTSRNSAGQADAMEWRRENETILLGRTGVAGASVSAPSGVVTYASTILGKEISRWRVNNFTERGNQIVCFTEPSQPKSRSPRHLVFVLLPDRWVLLNAHGGLDYINRIVETILKPPVDLKDSQLVAYYVEQVAYLSKGPGRVALSLSFLKQIDQNILLDGTEQSAIVIWMQGTEQDPESLRKLCGDPKVQVRGDQIQIQCKIITRLGSVEEWTLTGKLGNAVELTDISVKQIREDGTFSWGLIP